MMTTNSRQTRRGFLSASALLFVLSGCGNLIGPENPPGKIYVLAPRLLPPPTMPAIPRQLSIAGPEASASLATNRIALIRNDTLDYYADAQWTDPVPQLVRNLLVESIEQSGAMRAVGMDVEGIRADYILQTEIKSFEARYAQENGPPTAVIDITIKLVGTHSGTIVAARKFHHEAAATENSIPAAVAAFDTAASATLADVVRWISETAPNLDASASAHQS